MKRLLIPALFFFISSAVFAEVPVLVNASWVKENLSNPKLVILQVNFLRLDYEKEHIQGARFLWPEWLAPNSPDGNFNLPDIKAATKLLQGMGISNDTHIVLCHVRNEVTVTARMFLTLEHLGLRGRVSFLNGGLESWKKEGYAVTNEAPVVKKGTFRPNETLLIVDKNYVLQTLKGSGGVVVDARIKRFYDGDVTGNPRDGHISGAKNIPYTEMIDEGNMFKPVETLQQYFTPVATKDKELVTYCFIGQTASVVYMAGRILGYDMKLYDGSLQEWSRLEALPMEKSTQ